MQGADAYRCVNFGVVWFDLKGLLGLGEGMLSVSF